MTVNFLCLPLVNLTDNITVMLSFQQFIFQKEIFLVLSLGVSRLFHHA